jgi:hypothetical protein
MEEKGKGVAEEPQSDHATASGDPAALLSRWHHGAPNCPASWLAPLGWPTLRVGVVVAPGTLERERHGGQPIAPPDRVG